MDPIDLLIAETDETEQELREALAAAEGRIAVLESDGRRLLETAKDLVTAAGSDEWTATAKAWKEFRTVIAGVENGPLGMASVVAVRAESAGILSDPIDPIGKTLG